MNAENRDWGFENAEGVFEFAKSVIRVDGMIKTLPSEEDYRKIGCLPVIDEKPEVPDGFALKEDGMHKIDGEWVHVYLLEELPKPPTDEGAADADVGDGGSESEDASSDELPDEAGDGLPQALTRDDYDSAMEDYIRSVRCARGYTTREPSAYANSSNPRFAQDARDWQTFMDDVMEYALEVINQVEETNEVPTIEEFLADMPTVVWTYS